MVTGAWRKARRAQWTWNLAEDGKGLRWSCVREAVTPSLRSSVSRFTDGLSPSSEEEAAGPRCWWLCCRSGPVCLCVLTCRTVGQSGLDRDPAHSKSPGNRGHGEWTGGL